MKNLIFSILLLNTAFAVATPGAPQDIRQVVERSIQVPAIVPPIAQPQAPAAVLPQISTPMARAILASALALMAYFGTREDNLYINGIGFTVACLLTVLGIYTLIDR